MDITTLGTDIAITGMGMDGSIGMVIVTNNGWSVHGLMADTDTMMLAKQTSNCHYVMFTASTVSGVHRKTPLMLLNTAPLGRGVSRLSDT